MAALKKTKIRIRTMEKNDLPDADRIFRLAFGTWRNLPDPIQFGEDRDFVRTRWLLDAKAAFVAEHNGSLLGSNLVANWGKVGFFGPLTVHPDFWDKGIAQLLLESTMELFTQREMVHTGLFTFPESPKHIALYQKFGYRPRYLTGIMSSSVEVKELSLYTTRFSDVKENSRQEVLDACREVSDSIFEGLYLGLEISAVDKYRFGDTVLLWDNTKLIGFAICHCGTNTEAGNDTCYVKFAAVRQGSNAEEDFDQLLDACELLASDKGLSRLVAGMNTARHQAYEKMLERGFRNEKLGLIMQRPNKPGYNRPDVFLIDDWR